MKDGLNTESGAQPHRAWAPGSSWDIQHNSIPLPSAVPSKPHTHFVWSVPHEYHIKYLITPIPPPALKSNRLAPTEAWSTFSHCLLTNKFFNDGSFHVTYLHTSVGTSFAWQHSANIQPANIICFRVLDIINHSFAEYILFKTWQTVKGISKGLPSTYDTNCRKTGTINGLNWDNFD